MFLIKYAFVATLIFSVMLLLASVNLTRYAIESLEKSDER